MFTPTGNDYRVIGGGDLNSRVDNMNISKPRDNMRYRKNTDNVINSYGHELGRIYRSFSCFVVNDL